MDWEPGALGEGAAGFDNAAVGLDDSAGEGKTEAGAFLASGEKRAKDFREGIGRDAFAVVFDADEGLIAFAADCDIHGALAGDRLDSIEREIQDDLLNERGIVGYRRKGRIRRKKDLHGTRAGLLPGKQDGLLDGDVEVGRMKSGRPWTRVGEKVVQDGLDVEDFVPNVAEDAEGRAIGGAFRGRHVRNA